MSISEIFRLSELFSVKDSVVDQWTEENKERLLELLKQERDSLLGIKLREAQNEEQKSRAISVLSFSNRYLSEMPLCNFWKQIEPPRGFRRTIVSVQNNNLESGERLPLVKHVFASTPGGMVLCYTPGQFFLPLTYDTQSGERINIIQRLCPANIKTYKNGLARLLISKSDLSRKLGLRFAKRGFIGD